MSPISTWTIFIFYIVSARADVLVLGSEQLLLLAIPLRLYDHPVEMTCFSFGLFVVATDRDSLRDALDAVCLDLTTFVQYLPAKLHELLLNDFYSDRCRFEYPDYLPHFQEVFACCQYFLLRMSSAWSFCA